MNKYSGSNFDDFLEEEGILEEVSALAQKRVEKLDSTSGLIGAFLQWLQFNNQLVLRAATSVCVLIAIGVYLGNRYFSSVTETQPSKLVALDSPTTETQQPKLALGSPTKVEPTFVKGQDKDLKVSPFGFGTFPKIPADFPDQNIWNVVQKRAIYASEETKKLELLARVRIKLWEQGKHTKGVIMDPSSGLIYSDSNIDVLFPTSPDLPKYDTYFDEGFSPSGGIVVFLEGGINPYEFLDLTR